MSNLIPTPRVNKLGQTVIRHMRQETAKATAKNIPPVGMMVLPKFSGDPRVPKLARTVEKLIKPSGEWRDGLEALAVSNPDIIPLAAELMSTGNHGSREMTARMLKDSALNHLMNPGEYDIGNAATVPYTLKRAWYIGVRLTGADSPDAINLFEALPRYQIAELIQEKSDTLHPSHPGNADDPAYWKGVAAIAEKITRSDWVGMMDQIPAYNAERFVRLAGTQEDYSGIIEASVEFKTINYDFLKDLMERKSEAGALGDGLL